MKYGLILCLLIATPCVAQTKRTGEAKTSGFCSPAITGSNNTLTFNCFPDHKLNEVANFGAKITIVLANGTIGPAKDDQHEISIVASGFWVSSAGFAVTSLDSIARVPPSNLLAGVPFQPLLGNMIIVEGGVMYTPTQVVFQDREDDLAVVRIYGNPFERTMHMFARAENTKTGKTEAQVEQYAVAKLSSTLPMVGDEVVLVNRQLDPKQSVPTLEAEFDRVTRLGVDESTHRPHRIYLSLPFSSKYCGSAVLGASGEVLGISVSSDSEGHTVVVPAKYILELLADAKIEQGSDSKEPKSKPPK